MSAVEMLSILSRWIHVGTAIVVVGGTVFLRFVLLPVAEGLPQTEHDQLRAGVMGRWKKFVMIGIALFLLSGFYNYIVVSVPKHRGDHTYHMLMGIKITLAFVVFFFASVLVGRSPRFEPLRQARKKWLLVVLGLATVIIAISGYLKVTGV
jgi:uncharacterized membrane protein